MGSLYLLVFEKKQILRTQFLWEFIWQRLQFWQEKIMKVEMELKQMHGNYNKILV